MKATSSRRTPKPETDRIALAPEKVLAVELGPPAALHDAGPFRRDENKLCRMTEARIGIQIDPDEDRIVMDGDFLAGPSLGQLVIERQFFRVDEYLERFGGGPIFLG